MDTARNVPDGINVTEDKNLIIHADEYFDCEFRAAITEYCEKHNLKHEFSNADKSYITIYNPKNA